MPNSSTPLYDVVGIGRAYIDVIAPASYALLEKHGIPIDTGHYFDVEGIERIKSDLPVPVYYPGGTIPNTLSGLAALGAKVGYFGKVADDAAGHVFLEDLAARGITHLNPGYAANAPLSGTCIVLLTEGGERSFALHKGCVDAFTPEDLKDFDFNQTRFFVFPANLLSNTDDPAPFVALLDRAADSSCQIVFSLSEVRHWEGRQKEACRTATQASVFIGNAIENEAYFQITGAFTDPSKLIVTTHGADGASARFGDGTETHVPALPLEKIVSSLGAGDQFLAGFLHAQTLGYTLEASLGLAVRCAAAIIQETEARPQAGTSWKALI